MIALETARSPLLKRFLCQNSCHRFGRSLTSPNTPAHTTRIENNTTQSVGANQSSSIGQNQAITIGQNATQEVGQSMNLTVGGTGAGAAAQMGPLAGLAGQTSSMVGQALGAASGGGSGMSTVMGMMPAIASAAMGMLGASGQQAQARGLPDLVDTYRKSLLSQGQ